MIDETRRRYVREVYDSIHASEEQEDGWHRHSTRLIHSTIHEWLPAIYGSVANIGSGDQTYGAGPSSVDIDTSIRAIRRRPRGTVGDAHALPFLVGSFDVAICVGSVINYVALLEVAAELSRTLKPNGTLILEYERVIPIRGTSNADVVPREVTYRGRRHVCWFYSDAYVAEVLDVTGFEIRRRRTFHIASALLSNLGFSPAFASLVGWSDAVLEHWRVATRAANAILLCVKRC